MYEEFYRFGQPPFTLAPDPRFLYRSESHEEALNRLQQSIRRREGFILLTGDIDTMRRLVTSSGLIRAINLGGVHHKPGRVQRLRYLFLSTSEEQALRELASSGTAVSAQDVPAARPLPLEEVLAGEGNR